MKFIAAALTLGVAAMLQAAPAPAPIAAPARQSQFVYDDLDGFARAQREIAAGAAPAEAYARYLASGSPGLRAYAARYEVTGEKIAAEVARRPLYYAALPGLRPQLARLEGEIAQAARRLQRLSPMAERPPFFYLITDQSAGGTPVVLAPPGTAPIQGIPADVSAIEHLPAGIALSIDMMAIRPGLDMAEFPRGVGGRVGFQDVAQIAIHELVHVHQRRAVGSLDNFLSIYRPGGTMLANAVREGCAEYFTLLVSGRRLGERHLYGAAHETELWAEFRGVMDRPNFSVPGWFNGSNEAHPDWPPQIGYWVGLRICEAYYVSRGRTRQAVHELFTAWRPEEIDRIAAVYAARMERRAPRG